MQINPDLPALGADYNTWGGKLNAALEQIVTQGNGSDAQINGRLSTSSLQTLIGDRVMQEVGNVEAGGITDSFLAGKLADPTSLSGQALGDAVSGAQRHDGVYVPSPLAALRWRQTRTRVLAGDKQGHIAFLGDSIAFGAAAAGASNPKPDKCYPGRVRSILNTLYGDAGGGLTLANDSVLTNQAWDPRWTFSGDVVNHAFGPFASSAYRVNGDTTTPAYVEFTDVCREFWVYTLSSSGTFTYTLDGGAPVTVTNWADGSGAPASPTPRQAGYIAGPSSAHNVFRIDCGTTGSHTIRLQPTNVEWDVFLVMIEGRIPTPGTFRVGNMSISGESLVTFLNLNDEVNGLYGLPWLDTMRADLLVLALGINDWQGQRTIEETKTRLRQIIDRQRSNGTTGGGAHANGDVVLVWNPQPDIATLGGGTYTNPSWEQYRTAFYEIADEKDVCLIDMGERWRDYPTANSLGLFADAIHPGDAGADDMAAGVVHALFDVI